MLSDGLNASFDSMSEEQRESLAEYLVTRKEYLEKKAYLDGLRIQALQRPGSENEDKLQNYAVTQVAPLRRQMEDQLRGVLDETVDKESIQAMLPMVLMTLMQNINTPMLMTVLNFDPDRIDDFAEKASEYFKRGM